MSSLKSAAFCTILALGGISFIGCDDMMHKDHDDMHDGMGSGSMSSGSMSSGHGSMNGGTMSGGMNGMGSGTMGSGTMGGGTMGNNGTMGTGGGTNR